jgi:hypothetical protein
LCSASLLTHWDPCFWHKRFVSGSTINFRFIDRKTDDAFTRPVVKRLRPSNPDRDEKEVFHDPLRQLRRSGFREQGVNKHRSGTPGYVGPNPLIQFVNLADNRGPDRRRSGPHRERISSCYIEALRSSELGSRFGAYSQSKGNNPHTLFDAAYDSLTIERFGRLAKFDFLALLGRLDLAPIAPGSAYLSGATGPLRGARLLVDGNASSKSRATDLDVFFCNSSMVSYTLACR